MFKWITKGKIMTTYKNSSESATASKPPVDYTTDVARFENDQRQPSSGLTLQAVGYNVFVSDKGGAIGSYSITSRQESYRTLNLSFLSKANRR